MWWDLHLGACLRAHWASMKRTTEQNECTLFLACWHSDPDLNNLQEDRQIVQPHSACGIWSLSWCWHGESCDFRAPTSQSARPEKLTQHRSWHWTDSFKLARASLFAAWLNAESHCRAGEHRVEETAARISPHEIWQKCPPMTKTWGSADCCYPVTVQVSPAQLGSEILVWKRLDFLKSCHAYFRRGGNAKMDWRALKAYSHIFHWYQSHMAGFHY